MSKIDNYYKTEAHPWGIKPLRILEYAIDNWLPSVGNALDLGGGDGRNSLYLQSKGWKTTNIDKNETAINQYNESSNFPGIVGDISNFDFKTLEHKAYDLIICASTLYLLPETQAKAVLQKILDLTANNGLNIIFTWSPKGTMYKKGYGYFTGDYLIRFYLENQFELLHFDQVYKPTKAGGKHEKLIVVAKKSFTS